MKTFKRDEKQPRLIFQEVMVGDGDNTNKLSPGNLVIVFGYSEWL